MSLKIPSLAYKNIPDFLIEMSKNITGWSYKIFSEKKILT